MNPNVNVIDIHGKPAIDFSKRKDGKLAVVDLETLVRVTQQMPKLEFEKVKELTLRKLSETRNLEDFVSQMDSEVKFHETVNLIQNFQF